MKLKIDSLPSVKFNEREKLPACTAVYFAIDKENKILYVGRASHMRNRWRYHHRLSDLEANNCHKIAWLEQTKETYIQSEEKFIKMFDPPINGHSTRNPSKPPEYSYFDDSSLQTSLEKIYKKFYGEDVDFDNPVLSE